MRSLGATSCVKGREQLCDLRTSGRKLAGGFVLPGSFVRDGTLQPGEVDLWSMLCQHSVKLPGWVAAESGAVASCWDIHTCLFEQRGKRLTGCTIPEHRGSRPGLRHRVTQKMKCSLSESKGAVPLSYKWVVKASASLTPHLHALSLFPPSPICIPPFPPPPRKWTQ